MNTIPSSLSKEQVKEYRFDVSIFSKEDLDPSTLVVEIVEALDKHKAQIVIAPIPNPPDESYAPQRHDYAQQLQPPTSDAVEFFNWWFKTSRFDHGSEGKVYDYEKDCPITYEELYTHFLLSKQSV
jgi:hypothetical protein